jgi:hypothetical protein
MLGKPNAITGSFECVLSAEWNEINRRRNALGRRLLLDSGFPKDPNHIVGLALSGGGIRAGDT